MDAFEYIPYEPADPSCCEPPEPCEFVACVDVLEHIEPNLLDNVLDDLKRVIVKAGVLTVSTVAAKRLLPDGRNAHLIVAPMEWWLPKIFARWNVYAFQRLPTGFFVVVEKRNEH
jgi:2-polyprenyl-3-methyl-5-hydroxy-6-metoxy-1,4-benzoquinol methylase